MMDGNVFAGLPGELPEELIEVLARGNGVKVERIVSRGHCSTDDFWYDQEETEFVLVLRGAARIEFEDRQVEMKTGDFLTIAPHCKHRVAWTTPDEDTIWLAVFY